MNKNSTVRIIIFQMQSRVRRKYMRLVSQENRIAMQPGKCILTEPASVCIVCNWS